MITLLIIAILILVGVCLFIPTVIILLTAIITLVSFILSLIAMPFIWLYNKITGKNKDNNITQKRIFPLVGSNRVIINGVDYSSKFNK